MKVQGTLFTILLSLASASASGGQSSGIGSGNPVLPPIYPRSQKVDLVVLPSLLPGQSTVLAVPAPTKIVAKR